MIAVIWAEERFVPFGRLDPILPLLPTHGRVAQAARLWIWPQGSPIAEWCFEPPEFGKMGILGKLQGLMRP